MMDDSADSLVKSHQGYRKWQRGVHDALEQDDPKILDCICQGLTNEETARKVGLTRRDVMGRKEALLRALAPFAANVNVRLVSDTSLAVIWTYAMPRALGGYTAWKTEVQNAISSDEEEVLRYLACDHTDKEIAVLLGKEVGTIEFQLSTAAVRLKALISRLGAVRPSSRAVLAAACVYARLGVPPSWYLGSEAVSPYEVWRSKVLHLLTKKQQQTLHHVMLGRNNAEVACQLKCAEATIKSRLKASARQLEPLAASVGVENIHSRTGQAVLFAYVSPLTIEDYLEWRGRVVAHLTLRRLEILQLVAAGLTNRQIAGKLSMKELTVKSHLFHLSEKLQRPGTQARLIHPGSRTGLAVIAVHAQVLKEPAWQ